MAATLAQVRQRYPQYNNLSDEQLANTMYQRFYADMPRDQFDKKIGLQTSPVAGFGAVLNRSVPFFDEGADALDAGFRLAGGRAKNVKDAWGQARAYSKANADDFAAAHPNVTSLLRGGGLAVQAVPALLSGGATVPAQEAAAAASGGGGLLDGLITGGKQMLGLGGDTGAGSAAAVGLKAKAARLAAATGRNAGTAGTAAAINAFADTDGDLLQRGQAAGRAIPGGMAAGAVLPPVIGAAGAGINKLTQKTMTATEQAAVRAAAMLRAKAPNAGSLAPEDIPDGQFAFQQLGGGGRSLARAVAASPGPGADDAAAALNARRGEAGDRVMSTMQDSLGAGRGDYYPTMRMVQASRKAEADPLYQASKDTPINEIDFQQMMGPILNTEIGQNAMRSAQRIAEAKSAVSGQPMTWDSNIIDNGQVVGKKTPNADMLDLISQGWDSALKPYHDTFGNLNYGKLTPEGRAMVDLRQAYVKRLGDLVPANADARTAYSTGSDLLDKMQLGRDVVRKQIDPELVAENTAGLNPEQLQAQNTGMAYEIGGKLRGANPQGYFRQFSNDQNMQDRLGAAFGDGPEGAARFAAFRTAMQQEAEQQGEFNGILAGSRTTPLKEDIDSANAAGDTGQIDPDMLIHGAKVVLGGPKRWAWEGAKLAAQTALTKAANPALRDPEVNQRLSDALFQRAPQAGQDGGVDPIQQLLAQADQAKPIDTIDQNALLRMISAATRLGGAGVGASQDQP